LLIFFLTGGSVCPTGYAGLTHGWLGEYGVILDTHLFDLPNVSQAGLELVVVVAEAAIHLFSVYNVAWRSFLWSRDSVCQSFDSSWCFIPPSIAPASQQGFGVTELTLSGSAT
jgi:hypothetical protein